MKHRATEALSRTSCPVISFSYPVSGGSVVKTPPAVQEMWAQFLGQEDPLEEEMESHFTMLAWKIPWTEEPGGL